MNLIRDIVNEEIIERSIVETLHSEMSVDPENASNEQYYKACAMVLRELLGPKRKGNTAANYTRGKKQVYYLSMEFLMGRSLKNSLYNLGLVETFQKALQRHEVKLENLYECEPDPGLGNGGLGRLAACYLDGLATDGYTATGYSILFEYGIFKQKLSDGWQSELPDYWLPGGEVWLEPVPEHTVEVRFGGEVKENWDGAYHMVSHVGYSTVMAVPYNMYVTGYNTEAVSLLRLWKAQSPGIDMDLFNKGDYLGAFGQKSYAEVISKVLYPNDDHTEGKLLRLRQQYFLAAAAVGDIFRRHMSAYGTVDNFAEKNAIHINDTHPTLAIPELMRVLLDECGYSWERSWDIVTHSFAYTNHTVMSEALEKWDIGLMKTLLPRVYQIIEEINRRFCQELRDKGVSEEQIGRMSILFQGKVRMAHLCIAGSHSVNGVSALHSQIIRDDVFHPFYLVTPEKFKNVTNGIASRRWLMQSNPRLNQMICELIGDGFLRDFSQLTRLREFGRDEKILRRMAEIKKANKEDFARFLQEERGITVDPNTLFDVQVKRLHEYKRQHLNALHILHQYLWIKENPQAPFQPKTYIFGAKAAPGYYLAKQILKFICDLAVMIDNDPQVKGKLKVVFLEEYNVTLSEQLMPAAEISEQISLAGTEASGTGNMKLMLNGAITLGTLDGANVEILQQVGDENILIFGMKTPEVEALKARGYSPRHFIQQSGALQQVLAFLEQNRHLPSFGSMAEYLKNGDPYMAAADFESYCRIQSQASELYQQEAAWQRMSLMNVAGSGFFCADRAIQDYARDIWYL
ncbi:MAG: glycogen/starch/alpha-glucan phosphorylase [Angelakisella sp.]|jgi:starch phosphorylase|nr:glycogen/starch/alpha-glucan phosphorylase [Angelakisella sp.]MCI9666673.1 glycogen/starch/alpha-glucan phosphorylase [Angelakisella sp.]